MKQPPVVFAHGIWGTHKVFSSMERYLSKRGIQERHAINFSPADGSVSIQRLAEQLELFIEDIRRRTSAERVDMVGFSMGALASRFWMQRCNGINRVRRFISISAPHAGTRLAHLSRTLVARELSPGSELLADLHRDIDVLRQTELHCFYTPLDLMIIPPESSVLHIARSVRRFPVLLHRWMLCDPRVLEATAELLLA